MAKKPDERRMHAWESLLAGHHALVRTLGRELEEEHQLPLAWYEVLLRLNRSSDKRLRMQDLANTTYFSPSGMTRLIDRMVEHGFVERHQCETDRRGAYAVLTPVGKDLLREAAATHLRGIERYFGRHLSDQEADLLTTLLTRVADAASVEPAPAGAAR